MPPVNPLPIILSGKSAGEGTGQAVVFGFFAEYVRGLPHTDKRGGKTMNVLFLAVFLLSSAALVAEDPAAFLPALLGGAEKAVGLCLTLAAVYTVWLGLLRVAEDSGLLRGMARAVKPVTKKLFRTDDEEALGQIAVNLSANFLGMGGAATPAGVSAMKLLGRSERAEYARAMLFVINCAGLQLFPTTVISLRAGAGAASAYDVFLPILLSSAAALLLGAALVMLVYGRKK